MAEYKDTAKQDFHFVVSDEPPTPEPEKTEPFWKNWKAAVAIVAVVIVLGSLFGVRRSLTKVESRLTEQFYIGTDGSGYGIATDLDKVSEFSGNLVTVASKYGSTFSDQTQAVTEARQALAAAQTAGEKYAANQGLYTAVDVLSAAMEASGTLTAADETYRSQLWASIVSRNTIIAHEATDYNAQIRAYNTKTLGSFPAYALKGLAGVDFLEEYN